MMDSTSMMEMKLTTMAINNRKPCKTHTSAPFLPFSPEQLERVHGAVERLLAIDEMGISYDKEMELRTTALREMLAGQPLLRVGGTQLGLLHADLIGLVFRDYRRIKAARQNG